MHQLAAKEKRRHNHHQQNIQKLMDKRKWQHVYIFSTLLIQQHRRLMLLIVLILLQHADIYMCHHIPANNRVSHISDVSRDGAHNIGKREYGTVGGCSSTSTGVSIDDDGVLDAVGIRQPIVKKRRIGSGQPEEIFSFDDRIDTNYDEYPMVVPKRAALLLDRLMVALHHALEQERGKISDFYSDRNDKNGNTNAGYAPRSDEDPDQISANHMYSDDDPSVIMDYDFKDLNSINRATGETLMAKSFQRRGGMSLEMGGDLGNAEGVAMLTSAAAADDNSAGFGGGVGRNVIGNGGRMYWRCYFNAVSCF